MDLSKLKRHRGTKDKQELEEINASYANQIKALQGEIDLMQPNMKVGYCKKTLYTNRILKTTLTRKNTTTG